MSQYDVAKLQRRIAKALKWPLLDVQSTSLPALRDLVRAVAPKLAHEITQVIAEAAHVTRPKKSARHTTLRGGGVHCL